MAAPKQPKTLEQANTLLRGFCKTVSPYPLRITSTASFIELVFIEMFGQEHVTNIRNGKLLISKDTILYADDPASATGVRVEGLTRAEGEAFFQDIIDLQKDPTLKLHVTDSYNIFLKLVATRKAKSRAIIIEQLDQTKETETMIYNFWYNLHNPVGGKKFVQRIRNLINAVKEAQYKKAWKGVIEAKDKITEKIGSAYSIFAMGAAYRGARALFGKIPVLLGPCPLKHADYVEVARSGKVLKFRATGSIFLAAQQGGADAIKIEGTLYKAEFVVMFILWGLFLYGQSRFRDMDTIPGFNIGGVTDVTEIRKLNDLIMTNTDLERPTYEFHQTFPFVNKHFIIPNCYIETISIEDKLPLKDTLKYSILLRTYEKPTEVTWLEDKSTGSRISGFKNKTLSAKVCEYSLNAGWRVLNYMGFMIDDQEWKIGSAMDEGVTDTYYDVDWQSLSSVVYLNLIGAVT